MKPNSITITIREFPEWIDVDVWMNEKHLPDVSKSIEIDSENNKWDALIAAKNYAHEIISDYQGVA